MKHFTTSDGLSLAYRDEGSGLPLLCLPGLTRNGLDFQPVADEFAGECRVIRLDLRGRGGSDHDPDFHNYNVMVESRDVVEFLDHLGLDQAVILGTSRGGLIAMALAALAKDKLQGVILNDIGPHVDQEGMDRIMTYLGLPPGHVSLDAAAEATKAMLEHEFPGLPVESWRWFLSNTWRETPDGLELIYDASLRDAVKHTLSKDETLPDLWPLFDLLEDVPLALLRGQNSDILSAEVAAEMRGRRPDMGYAEIPDRGHIPFLNEPGSVALIRSSLQRFAV